MDRTIHFGDDEADARYRIQDTSSTGGDLVLAEDLDGGTVLLEYDYSASEWVSRGPVNLDGNDITNAGSISASTLEATNGSIAANHFGRFERLDADAPALDSFADYCILETASDSEFGVGVEVAIVAENNTADPTERVTQSDTLVASVAVTKSETDIIASPTNNVSMTADLEYNKDGNTNHTLKIKADDTSDWSSAPDRVFVVVQAKGNLINLVDDT